MRLFIVTLWPPINPRWSLWVGQRLCQVLTRKVSIWPSRKEVVGPVQTVPIALPRIRRCLVFSGEIPQHFDGLFCPQVQSVVCTVPRTLRALT